MADKSKWNVQSRVIAARLHPDNEKERDALKIFDMKRKKGFAARDIITDAILRAEGYTPEMFDGDDTTITQGQLERTLEDFARYIVEEIQANGVTAGAPNTQKTSPFDDDGDMDVMRNMAAGYLNRRKRG